MPPGQAEAESVGSNSGGRKEQDLCSDSIRSDRTDEAFAIDDYDQRKHHHRGNLRRIPDERM